jgi:group I intron endonuclease
MIVYKIENKINGKIYIGQTINLLKNRIIEHIKENKNPIQKALNKYGSESFNITIIDHGNSREDLKEKEIHWISFYNSKVPNGYNITNGGEGFSGSHTKESKEKNRQAHLGKKVSEETLQKMRKPHGPMSEETKQKHRGSNNPSKKPEVRKKISQSLKGKTFSKTHILNLSKSHTGFKHTEESLQKMRARKHTKETIQKIRESLTGRKHTEESLQKMRENHVGFQGKHHSEETKQKQRTASTGRKHTEESLQKMRDVWKKRKKNV